MSGGATIARHDGSLSPFVTIRWTRDSPWRVVAVDGDIEGLTGHPSEAFLIGHQDYGALIHEADSPAIFERIAEVSRGDATAFTLFYRIVMPSGRERRVWDETRIARDPAGEPVAFVSYIVAIDALPSPRQAEEFVAHASHEIRTPLTGIVGMAEALAATPLAPVQQEIVDALREGLADLMQLVNNMLDLAKLDAGAMELDVADFRLGALCVGAERLFGRRAAAKGLKMFTRGPPIDPLLRGDAGRVRQIVYNLVGNAVKFTDTGHVAIEWSVGQPDSEGRVAIHVAVQDSGPGLSPEEIGRVFDSYWQAGPRIAAQYGGTGLGLSIARALAAMMGGRLVVESVPGEGSIFRFEAMLDLSSESQPDTLALEREQANAAARALLSRLRPRVLVAEDAVAIQRVLDLMLTPLGAKVTVARDGIEAVAAYSAQPFDLVLMDSRLPRLGGLEATVEIRAIEAREGRPRVPLLALTAETLPRSIEAFLRAGADGFLPKPFDPQRLIRTIAAMLPAEPAAGAPEPSR